MKQIKWKKKHIDLERVGKGLYAKVYKSYDPLYQTPIAIKVLKDLEIARHEVAVMEQYGASDFLPALYDSMIIKDKAYIVMEYIEGKPLGKNFDSTGEKKAESLSVQITINILKGLHDLHQCGYMHRDIKPKNVMLRDDQPETVRVIDFNHAQEIKNNDSIQRDLQDAARMCLFLMEGSIPASIHDIHIPNQQLQAVLLKAFVPSEEHRYHSAAEFIEALEPFR